MPSIREKLAGKTSKLALPRERVEGHPADPADYRDGDFCTVEISLVSPDPNQPRKFFDPDSLAELSESVRQKGVLQPVIIRREAGGKIILVAGERRFRAAKAAGLEKIPAILTRGNPMEIALIENLQRDNLRPVEEAEALGRMVDEYDYTHEQLAFVIGKARSTISEALSLNRLPEDIREECRRSDAYPRRLLVEVARQETEARMRSLFKRIRSAGLKSAEVREITRNRPPQRDPRVAAALQKTLSLEKSLAKLDVSSAPREEVEPLFTALRDLVTAVGDFFDRNR